MANLTWVKNNHTFKFGAEVDFEGYPNYNIIGTTGQFNFSANETALPYLNTATVAGSTIGLPYASFLLGLPDNYVVNSPAVARLGKHQLGIFAQDSWKVTRKLSLELGLRYDYSTSGKEQYGRYGFFDPKVANTQDGGRLGGVTYGATCGCDNNFFNSYKLGFGPRLGFAYQLTPKTVLRGGAGLLIGTTPDNGIQSRSVTSLNQVFSTAFAQSPLTNGLHGGIPLTFAQIAWPNFNPSNFPVVAVPGTPGAAPAAWIDKNAGYPSKSYQWSFGVQREIVRNLVVDVAYVGNRGVWLPSSGALAYNSNTPQSLLAAGIDITTAAGRTILNAPLNSVAAGPFQNKVPYAGFPLTSTVAQSLRPYPQFTTAPTALWAPLGDNWYESLQLKVIKRLSHGLDVSYNFTWSKTLQNSIEAGTENDIFNRSLNKTLSGSDRPLVSNITVTYTVPTAPWASNKILKYVLSDWQTGALLTYASGTPILVPASTNSLNTSYFLPTASYLNRVPGQPLFIVDLNCHCYDPTKTLVLNPAAWVNPAVGTYSSSAAYYNDYRSQRHPTENFNIRTQLQDPRVDELEHSGGVREHLQPHDTSRPKLDNSAKRADLLRVGYHRRHYYYLPGRLHVPGRLRLLSTSTLTGQRTDRSSPASASTGHRGRRAEPVVRKHSITVNGYLGGAVGAPRVSSRVCASRIPFSAARRNHVSASASFFRTPRPSASIRPRSYSAGG